jgi:DNA-binding GntR family transcriptional regulator
VGIGLADGVPISLEHAMFPAEVVAASADEAAILSIEPGARPISITRTTRDARGFAFE